MNPPYFKRLAIQSRVYSNKIMTEVTIEFLLSTIESRGKEILNSDTNKPIC